jgi:hypothetical protein
LADPPSELSHSQHDRVLSENEATPQQLPATVLFCASVEASGIAECMSNGNIVTGANFW